jgi:hypothetical protein
VIRPDRGWGRAAFALLLAGSVAAQEAADPPRAPVSSRPVEDAVAGRDRALAWLCAAQREDGCFSSRVMEQVHEATFSVETFHAWGVAAHALACQALLEGPETEVRRAALDRGLRWFAASRTPRRGNEWDNDAVWAWLYGFVLAVEVAADPRFAGTEPGAAVAAKGREFLGCLLRNQVPEGGFGYYDDPPYTRRPKWATSFCTALAVPALLRAIDLGWLDDPRVAARAVRYVQDCRLPNGAFAYDLRPVPRSFAGESIDTVKGALGRIQVCHWALRAAGDEAVDHDDLRRGLGLFFAHHRFLSVARMRPIPHEAYYANAGYFFHFGHHYAARVIGELPAAEREVWHGRLRARLLETQREDGSFCDFLGSNYMVVAGTAFAAMALDLGVPAEGG